MSTPAQHPLPTPIVYPSSDGKRMAENTQQGRWIVVLYGNLSALFADRPDVFVATDNLWYPVEGRNDVRVAPDVYVVFGRPKGDRPSYQQWREGGIPLTVAFEVLSPGNTPQEMRGKLLFYEEYGVEEYYVYNPDTNRLQIFLRSGAAFRRIRQVERFISPRLGIRFVLTRPEMTVYGPDGRPFLTFEQVIAERRHAEERAEQAHARAEQERSRAEQERSRAEQERSRAEQEGSRAEQAEARAARAEAEIERLRRRLEQAGLLPDGPATGQ